MANPASTPNATTRGGASGAPILSQRALNRALLARQMLLERDERSVPDALRHLFGMQAQAPFPPYFGLWSRLKHFDPHELGALIESRQAVRISLLRDTVHLVMTDDALHLRAILADFLKRRLLVGSAYAKRIALLDENAVAEVGRVAVDAEPRTMSELGSLLNERWPDHDGEAMAMVVRNLVPLVQIPPRGVWGKSGLARCTSLEVWSGAELEAEPSIQATMVRYLAAYGPASVMDAQAWCGLTKLGEVFERLRPQLVTFRDELGRELFDLPDAPRPDADTPAPVRFIPEYDNLLLSHADRSRIVADDMRRWFWTANGVVPGGLLADGRLVGIWKIRQAKKESSLWIRMHDQISPVGRDEIESEGRRLLEFATPNIANRSIVFENPA
ncbi:MAG: winged helix DNA-binding domain-containing protein [Thermomicrobiales bacterium]